MPIYAYRCAACGHAKDMLQKISDAPLSVCPACGAPRFEKQVTAAGFQLKGSGWYATDFRDGAKAKSTDAKTDAKPDVKTEGKPDTKPASEPAAAPAAPAPAAAPPPAGAA